MTTEAAGATAPQTQAPAVQPTGEAPATIQTAPDSGGDLAWLPDRLKKARESERKKLLAEFGVEDTKQVREQLQRLKTLEEQSLSEQERTKKQLDELTPKAARAEALQSKFAQLIDVQFNALPEAQRNVIDARAGGDAEKRWEIMQLLSELGGSTAVAPGATATTAPAARPASTTANAPPPPAPPAAPNSPRSIYEAKLKTSPVEASIYYQLNAAAINNSTS